MQENQWITCGKARGQVCGSFATWKESDLRRYMVTRAEAKPPTLTYLEWLAVIIKYQFRERCISKTVVQEKLTTLWPLPVWLLSVYCGGKSPVANCLGTREDKGAQVHDVSWADCRTWWKSFQTWQFPVKKITGHISRGSGKMGELVVAKDSRAKDVLFGYRWNQW